MRRLTGLFASRVSGSAETRPLGVTGSATQASLRCGTCDSPGRLSAREWKRILRAKPRIRWLLQGPRRLTVGVLYLSLSKPRSREGLPRARSLSNAGLTIADRASPTGRPDRWSSAWGTERTCAQGRKPEE
eukprot:2202119-Pleurochrysis_carterae.AAC.2